MQLSALFLLAPALVAATLDPATSNTKGKCPSSYNCSATKVSKAIQAAECSHNTRTSKTQTFAVFETDHQYDGNNGYPYGTCSAYTCESPTEMITDDDCWTFFWSNGLMADGFTMYSGTGEEDGVGTGCIKDPNTGVCGCENSDGTFISGASDCT
ncbi:hypothetical protein CPAR01_07313 [Colletotrichum paranaense]|uniref:Small secreted protein n=2 Tax=Colletotrichum acutatum species complex TaxID=2707335 RepID=A0AAI9XMR5_9PEZI|nr:uncharacterized protein CPAR01_07313 [Colletotrichum paranaense]KAK1456227.1 hypothetical protein CMEL01_16495 [Colletotrichum melonis]KAK1541324.1 hypothetical protein CPAR01_07313 [Colletotrichum paranaense]